MTIDIRPIAPEELAPLLETVRVAFLEPPRGMADAAAFRLPHLDLSRVVAAFEGGRIVGTYRSWPTELTLPGSCTTPASAVTMVTVLPTHRRRGILTRMMEGDLRASKERGESVAILIAAEYPIYGRYGFGPAADDAALEVDSRSARFVAPAEGTLKLVEPAALRELAPPLYERFRTAQPGSIERRPYTWNVLLGITPPPDRPATPQRMVVHRDDAGELDGWLRYHVEDKWEHLVPNSTLIVDELIALEPAAYAALWRYCAEVDLVRHVRAEDRPVDEPLPWLLEDARAVRRTIRSDFLWVRVLDVERALSDRTYLRDGRVVLEVHDDRGYAAGRFALEGGPDGSRCRRADEEPGLALGVRALGSALLGGPTLGLLAAAGQVEERVPGALATADAMFRSPIVPWCATWF